MAFRLPTCHVVGLASLWKGSQMSGYSADTQREIDITVQATAALELT